MELLVADSLARLTPRPAGGKGQAGARSAPGAVPTRLLFSGVSLTLREGDRLGLVGPNRSGKSTLLRLLAGFELPDEGTVWRAPGVRVALLPQSDVAGGAGTLLASARAALGPVEELEAQMIALSTKGATQAEEYSRLAAEHELRGGFGAEATLLRELFLVGFRETDLTRNVATLSAGERRRLALAKVLAASPDVLLLDEPTNHLDLLARSRLADRLAAWHGALLIVSHDRALLERSTTRTAFLGSPGRGQEGRLAVGLTIESGSYETARRRQETLGKAAERGERERAKEAARLEAMAQELARFGQKAQARKRAAERARRRLLAAGTASAAPWPPDTKPTLAGGAGVTAGKVRLREGEALVYATDLTFGTVATGVSLTLTAGDRVALLGENGSGKSTLLKLLAGELPSEDPRSEIRYRSGLKLRHVGQVSRGLQPGRPVMEQVAERASLGSVEGILARAGLTRLPPELLPEELSGGERVRLGLTLAFLEDADVWLLDEPTNDLDLGAVEALEEQLAALLDRRPAALVLATHDLRFAERLTTTVWALQGGQLLSYRTPQEFLGGRHAGQPVQPLPAAQREAPVASPLRTAESAPGPLQESAGTAHSVTSHLVALEDERARLHDLLSGSVELSKRERSRALGRLRSLEDELVTLYDARFTPPAPRYRLREGGYLLYADDLTGEGSSSRHLAVVAVEALTAPTEASLAARAAAALTLLARSGEAAVELMGEVAGWLELWLVDGIAHLRLREPQGARALPPVKGALVSAGAYLAFTRLGATAVQLYHQGELPGSLLKSAGDDWWSLGLGEFLLEEGWRKW